MEPLAERFDALQRQLLALFEKDSEKIEDQILYWLLMRKESALMHYARQQGLTSVGLQSLPVLTVSENNAKQAIMMGIYLSSLQKSIFGKEPWTMTDTSYERFVAAPSGTFKKHPFEVSVWFDNDPENTFPYTNWGMIYYQDSNDIWHRAEGRVTYSGLYYTDHLGTNHYFQTFDNDAQRYGSTGQWEVHYKNKTISASVVSSSSWGSSQYQQPDTSEGDKSSAGDSPTPTPSPRRRPGRPPKTPTTPKTPTPRTSRVPRTPRRQGATTPRQRRRRQGEPASPERGSWPSPAEVGRGFRTPTGHYSSRLARLTAEARDPPVILVKGGANCLKCWRNRVRAKHKSLYVCFSSIFQWIGLHTKSSRMLVVFNTDRQRAIFLETVKLPKGTQAALGSLDSI